MAKTITSARSLIRLDNVPDVIDSFDGDYAFLSNFFPAPIIYRGHLFQTSEHAYQAQKCLFALDKKEAKRYFTSICGVYTPLQAKRLGGALKLDKKKWDSKKVEIMTAIIDKKFEIPAFDFLLLQTGESELIEGNFHRDYFWGKHNGKGLNKLGRILMQKREQLRSTIYD